MFQDALNSFCEAMTSPDKDKWAQVSQEAFKKWASGNWSQDQKIEKQLSADGCTCSNLMGDTRHA